MEMLDYEKLAAEFEQSLLTQLRGHSSALPFLEGWVPDDDPVLGILNLVEAAEIAGESAIAVRVAQATLPSSRLPELGEAVDEFGTLDVREAGAHWELKVEGIGTAQLLRHVAPAYRAALRARLGALVHAGGVAPAPGEHLLKASRDGVVLSLAVNADGVITAARHDGAADPACAAVLDVFCEVLRGLPVQEASDHGGHRLVARLAAPGAARPVPGILLPENAAPIFALPCALARRLLADWRALSGAKGHENMFAPAPASPWARLAPAARRAEVARALAAWTEQSGLPEASLTLEAMEQNILGYEVRAIIGFAPDIAPEAKPALARQAEAHLKRALDPELELYVVELSDQNKIRRL